MSKPVFNIDEAEFVHELKHGDRFDARIAPISLHLGAKKLSYNLTEVAPGRRAFPFHNHHTNEEFFFIVSGEGSLRFGEEKLPVREGDCIACPPGGTEVAHQLVNTGSSALRYLALSTTIDTDVFQYPDSGKFGVVAGRKPGMRPQDSPFGGFFAESGRVDYWDGE